MRFVLLPLGTYGDLLPFLEIGAELRKRGHDVLVGSAAGFQSHVEGRGLKFGSILPDAVYRKVIADPRLWHSRKFFETFVLGWMCPAVKPIVSLVQSQPQPEEVVIVAAMTGGPGARTAAELTGARMASLWPVPADLRSAVAPPVYSGLGFLPSLPYSLRRLLLRAVDLNADLLAAGPINRVRRQLGLPPVHNVMHWLGSEHCQLGLFPDWYCPRQRDWPAHLELVGFPLSTGRGELSPEAVSFLASGPPPVAITFGTGMQHGRSLFSAAVEACRIQGARPMLIAPMAEGVPDCLPEGVKAFGFEPFADLLPRVRAIIHHGGMGTAARALTAGLPQVVLPLAHDQFDSLARVRRLGCGDGLPSARVNPSRLASVLGDVLDSPAIADACRLRSGQAKESNGIRSACDVLERC